MSEWLCSFHQTKRKRPNILQQHAIRSKESDDDWSKYEPNNRPHKFSNATPRINATPNISSTISRSTSGCSIVMRHSSSGELPNALVEAYRNRARCKPNRTTDSMLSELSQSVSESLNTEQRCVVEAVIQGRSVFFTGPAGCGKTHIINLILQLNDQAVITPKRQFIVTATTGIAACAIGGVTIHSFAGIGTGLGRESEIVGRVMGNAQAVQRWRQCDCLIIDEISMMSAECLDLLNVIASRTRNSREVFGGMQVVVCGDFFQLPPIGDSNNTKFAFEAKCWPKTFVSYSIVLKQIFRQSNDEQFMTILNEARVGELSSESTNTLRVHSMISSRNECSGEYTQLQCRNHQVDQSNSIEMSKLSGEEHVFNAKDFIGNNAYSSQLKQCSSQERLVLKVGAAVILLKNIDPEKGLVNGSRGLVVDFQKATKNSAELPREFRSSLLPVVQFESACKKNDCLANENDLCILVEPVEWASKVGDTIVCSRTQIPLRLAWALSVHKSQGMTIPRLAISLKGVFEFGQAYVALSRATELKNLILTGFHKRAFVAHPRVKLFYKLLVESSGDAGGEMISPPALTNCRRKTEEKKFSYSESGTADTALTPKQLQIVENNRQRAIMLRKQKENEMKQANNSFSLGILPSIMLSANKKRDEVI